MVDRSRFGSWGVELSEDELARAVAGALQPKQASDAPVRVEAWQRPARAAAVYGDAARPGTRFEVAAELLDLAELLSRPAAGAGSVFVAREIEEASVVWTYPLRIGLLPGYRDAEARAIADLPWKDVYEVVELSETATECDLLLLPGNFRSSLAAVLERRLTIHADLVLVLGKLEEAGARALRFIDVLRDATDAAGVAVAHQPRPRRVEWFREFIRELTHDKPLDVALFARNDGSEPPPLLVASRKLIDATQLKPHIRKMTEAIESVTAALPVAVALPDEGDAGAIPSMPSRPPAAPSMSRPGMPSGRGPAKGGAATAGAAPAGPRGTPPRRRPSSNSGTGGGVSPARPIPAPVALPSPRPDLDDVLIDFHRLEPIQADSELHLASALGRAARKLPPGLRHAASRATPRDPDERRVVHATFDKDGRNVQRLAPGKAYRVAFRIGFPAARERGATGAFPHNLLPPSLSGHRLTVVFAELPQDESDDFRQPETRELFLPPVEETEAVEFWFQTRANAARFDARVIVLHQNRVLQTLHYGAALDRKERIALDPELDVYRLDDLQGRTGFDAALVANKASGRMAVCEIVNGKARYVAPAGLEKQVENVSAVLDQATTLVKLPKKLSDAKLMQVMLTLSHEGNDLWTILGLGRPGSKLARANRVQVVAARPGEYLPVEFLYGRPVPLKPAICKNALEVLSEKSRAKCSTVDPNDELCPVEFWGLSRVIEHVAWSGAATRKTSKSVRTKPLLASAVVGLSNRVPKGDATKLMKTLDAATNGNAHRAKSWEEWAKLIDQHQPSLLVLLPHTGIFLMTGKPGLELGGHTWPISAIEEKHVRKEGTKDEPVVLLLGCDTRRAPTEYQNAVERLKLKQAGVVLGTLSTVLGPHAAAFAGALVTALAESAGSAAKFGDVLLKVKRQRIRAGDPFALTLVAYGDSEIRI